MCRISSRQESFGMLKYCLLLGYQRTFLCLEYEVKIHVGFSMILSASLFCYLACN